METYDIPSMLNLANKDDQLRANYDSVPTDILYGSFYMQAADETSSATCDIGVELIFFAIASDPKNVADS